MMPNFNQMAILKILIANDKPFKRSKIRKILKQKYKHNISTGRMTDCINFLSNKGYINVISYLPEDVIGLEIHIEPLKQKEFIEITDDGRDYYGKLRQQYATEVNHYNEIFGYEKLVPQVRKESEEKVEQIIKIGKNKYGTTQRRQLLCPYCGEIQVWNEFYNEVDEFDTLITDATITNKYTCPVCKKEMYVCIETIVNADKE